MEPSTKRNIILLAVLVATVGIASWRFLAGGAADLAPDDQFIGFHCPACDHHFTLSHREFERRFNSRECHAKPGGGILVKCPKCENFTAERADSPSD